MNIIGNILSTQNFISYTLKFAQLCVEICWTELKYPLTLSIIVFVWWEVINIQSIFNVCPRVISGAAWFVYFNSLWPSDAKWRRTPVLTLARVIACWLMAPNHSLNQYWLFIKGMLMHSSQSNFTRIAHERLPICNVCSEVSLLKLLPHPPVLHELNTLTAARA